MPTLGQKGTAKLPPRALGYLNARAVLELVAGALAIALTVSWIFDGDLRVVLLPVLGVLTVVSLCVELPVLNRLRLRYTSYSVEPGYVYITRGAIIRSSVLIPTRNILNVETVEGPLLRRFGFVKVRFRCITDTESLGPLDPAAVVDIRRAIAYLGERDDHALE